MIQGTMSGVGKSILTAGILRVLHQDGYRVAPFKSQNMALNSFVTKDNREIGRAQALQAMAAGIEPTSDMNPILLKPMGDTLSQIIVNGLPIGNMKAAEYFRKKKSLIPDILSAYEKLCEKADIIVIEGAGSPVEINLRENDIVNMGLAEIVDAPVIIAGDIDPGGVFAQLLGTVNLLSQEEKERVKGLIINKFRGDVTLLEPGLDMFKAYCDIPFAGIVPFVKLDLDEEDSVSKRLNTKSKQKESLIKIAVIRLPFISNYTDFTVFDQIDEVSVCYVTEPDQLKSADLVILPGTKNTISDLKWLKEKGFAQKLIELAGKDVLIIGICGGFQMLGKSIKDPINAEIGGEEAGLSLLPVETEFGRYKNLKQVSAKIGKLEGIYEPLSDIAISGYEIHMGESNLNRNTYPVAAWGTVLGTYVHGIFDSPEFTKKLIEIIFRKRGIDRKAPEIENAFAYQEKELNKLADVLRQSLDLEMIYRIIGI